MDMKNLFNMLCEVPWRKVTGYILYQCDNVKPPETFAASEEMTADMSKTTQGARVLHAVKRATQQWGAWNS
eukprot:12906553-Prorocentrum_lima.AAC.1